MNGKILLTTAALFLIVFALSPNDVLAQKKRPKPKGNITLNPKSKNSAVVKAGAQKVADQIKNLTHFLFLFGGATKTIEDIENAARKNQASRTVLEQNAKSKGALIILIRNIRTSLADLEDEFRTTQTLKPFYLKLNGVADIAAIAEEQATANDFNNAGKTLVQVVNQLTDALLEIH